MSRAEMDGTTYPLCRMPEIHPSCDSRLQASRMGVRLVSHRSARFTSARKSPGRNSHCSIQFLSNRYTRSTSPSSFFTSSVLLDVKLVVLQTWPIVDEPTTAFAVTQQASPLIEACQ